MRTRSRAARDPQSGFALSSEVLLIAVILVCGLITGWMKLRDQSTSEIKDAIAAVDAYIAGMAPAVQPYQQQWITSNGVGCDMDGLPSQPAPPATCASAVTEVIDPGGANFTLTGIDLQYRPAAVNSMAAAPAEADVLF